VEHFTPNNRVTLLRDAAQGYPAMLRAIEDAERSVYLEMYWFASDEVGERFKTALLAASRRGVEVAVIYDSVGSLGTDDSFFWPLRQHGAVEEFNPIAVWHRRFRLARLTRRDHRKLLVVDGKLAVTGGMNIGREWLPFQENGDGWRDDGIVIEGDAVQELERCFRRVWSRVGGRPLKGKRPRSTAPSPVGEANVAVLPQSARRDYRRVVAVYVERVMRARERIWIANAYFVPGRQLVRELKRATRRGVDVRIIVPSVSDVPLVRHASRAVWGGLLAAGAEIYEWQPSVLHSKTALIDSEWTTLGSVNLDALSVRNLELNVSVQDRSFAVAVEQSFLQDLEQCRAVDRHDFAFRSLGDRVFERVAYWFRGWL
jgi:cardiolipin synthase A/B